MTMVSLKIRNFRAAFTLIELLVACAVMGILAGIVLPAVQKVREAARRTECVNNLRQVAIAIMNFESTRQKLPTGITTYDALPHGSTTWLAQILPYVEQQNVWDQAVSDYNVDANPFQTHIGMRTIVPTYQCPSDPASGKVHWTHNNQIVATTSYLGVNGTDFTARNGVFFLNSAIRMGDVSDGTSNTLMLGERPPSADLWYGWWYAGRGQSGSGSPDMILGVREINTPPASGETNYLESCPYGPYRFTPGKSGQQCDTLHFWSFHPSGANFALCDASVHFVHYGADDIMPQLATRAGDEVFTSPF